MSPPWPLVELPVCTLIMPVLPKLDVPVSRSMAPLTPLLPASGVRTRKSPLEVLELKPVTIET